MTNEEAKIRLVDGSVATLRDPGGGPPFEWSHSNSVVVEALERFSTEEFRYSSTDPSPLWALAAAAASRFQGELIGEAPVADYVPGRVY